MAVTLTGRIAGLPGFLQRPRQVYLSGAKSRSQSKEQTPANGNYKGEDEYRSIHLNGGQAFHLLRLHGQKHSQRAPSKTDRSGGSTTEQQDAFGEQLKNQATASGAHRGSQGDFASAFIRSREQEIGYIGARNQEHQTCPAKECQKGRTDVSHQVPLEGNDLKAERRLNKSGEFRTKMRGDGLDFLLCLRNGDAIAKTSDYAQITLIRGIAGKMGAKGNKRVHFRRNTGALGENDFESRRQDSNDCRGLAVEAHGPANQARVSTIAAAPKAIAEDRYERRAGSFLTGNEQTSQPGIAAKNAKEVGCHHAELDLLGFGFARQRTTLRPDSAQVLEQAAAFADGHEFRPGSRSAPFV